MSNVPFVSVILPVWNDPKVELCLDGLSRQTYPRGSFEAIVIDNGAEGDSEHIACRFPFARLLWEPRPGSYSARNAGIAVARGDVLAFTDADCVPEPDWLEAGVAELARLEAGLLAGRIDVTTRAPGRPTPVELYEVVFGYRQEQSVLSGRAAYTANLFVAREVFDKAGAFDSSLLSGGDFEFSRRAQAEGFALAYSDLPAVTTPARSTLASLWRRSVRLRGGQQALRRVRASGAPWLQGRRGRRPSRWADLRLIMSHHSPLPARLGAVAVALFVRVAFRYEGARLALGGTARR